jgi:3-dehydroquinate synthase
LFELLEAHGPELIATHFQLSGTPDVGSEVVGRAIAGMAEELEPNLWEKDLQRSVDYGHSFSPLVEMRALPELLHGEAVAMDCVFSAALARHRSLITAAEFDRIVSVAERLGLAPSHPLFCDVPLLTEALADTVRHRDGDQNLPILTGIGQVCFLNDVTDAEIEQAARVMRGLLPQHDAITAPAEPAREAAR